jgi:cytochrome c peroxidase
MAARDRDPLSLVGTTIDGRYEILELADEGGFGFVYKAQRVMWDKPVAIKLFKQRQGDSEKRAALAKAFIAEGAVLSELSRKTTSIVQSFDVGTITTQDGEALLYTALEWLDGITLAELVDQERQGGGHTAWPLARVIDTLEPIAVALEVAHLNGVAHRDIKPANIFLVRGTANATTAVKLLDFGVAKVVEDLALGFEDTGHHDGPYTPKYGAPEQFAKRHGTTGPWSDVYALAMVAVELLLGRYPFGELAFGELVFAACDTSERPTPMRLGVQVSREVELVFTRALTVKAADRYRDAGEFWAALVEASGIERLPHPTQTGRIATLRTLPPPRSERETGDSASTTGAQTHTVSDPPPPARRIRVAWAALPLGALVAAGAWLLLRPPAPAATAPSASASAAAVEVNHEHLTSFAALPEAIEASHNPISESKVRLGRMLFHDPRLSRDSDISCDTCHDLDAYGVDGRRFPMGYKGQRGTRNAPSVFHAAGAMALGWDGASPTIEDQVRAPLFNAHEMAMNEADLLERLRAMPGYVEAFALAFPEANEITLENIGRALGAFERKLVTPGRWDQFLVGASRALSDDEKRGFTKFVEVGCVTCHVGPYVGLGMFQKLGLVKPWPKGRDRGRYHVTNNDGDDMVFRVPSLRNVERTAPYFHDGSVTELDRAVRLMAEHQLGKVLSDQDVTAITAWLHALTGDLPRDLVAKPELVADAPDKPGTPTAPRGP